MKAYQEDFIRLAIEHQVLCFGDFTLKSGRKSPYFFNAGRFKTGAALAELGRIYAAALVDSGIDVDMVFGPAYKGIPLVSSMAIALARDFGRDLPYAFNRKEKKSHGEGGSIVGAPLHGNVALVDDVITAGTAIREVMVHFDLSEAKAEAVIIGLDRQEKPEGSDLSAIASVEQELGLKVVAIVTLEEVLEFLDADPQYQSQAAAIRAYRQ